MISGPLPHQATSVATITAGQQPGLPIPQLINKIGRNRATELSLTITAEDNSQLPLGTTKQVEETAGFTAPVMFQLPSLEMTIPLVDTFLALSVQIPFSYIPVEKWMKQDDKSNHLWNQISFILKCPLGPHIEQLSLPPNQHFL
ncbi:uncharacterized protein LOC120660163 isoform X1 [Panicum virgatum]|nr:uncharacterized protein LOC120660163 isoform X1 [Panicum virgatum]